MVSFFNSLFLALDEGDIAVLKTYVSSLIYIFYDIHGLFCLVL